MTAKEFFKPTKGKIILTIIFILIFPLPYWNGILCERCLDEPCPPCPDTNFSPSLIGWYFTWGGAGFYRDTRLASTFNPAIDVLSEILITLLIIGLPISYLCSCSIVFVYKKIKKTR